MPDEKLSFSQKLKNAFTDPKVVIVILGMLASVSAWGTKLLIDFGELKATQKATQNRINDLKIFHAHEMQNMNKLIKKILERPCGGSE